MKMKKVLRKYRRQKRSKAQGSPDLLVFSRGQVLKAHIVPKRASIEGVPVEIQQAILHQMPDLPTLNALVTASPTYLRAYQGRYNSILSDVFLRDIHPDVLVDALTIVDALKLPRNYDDYVPNLKAFVEQYKTTRASLNVGLKPLEMHTIEKLCALHLSVIAVTEAFCNFTFCSFFLSTYQDSAESLDQYASLSSNEIRRIHRAFYRYELFTVLFHEPDIYLEEQCERHRDREGDRVRLALQRDSIRSLDAQDKSFLFLDLFQTWEVEEVACVCDYITHRYAKLYKECKSELQGVTRGKGHQGTGPWYYTHFLELPPESEDMVDQAQTSVSGTANVLLVYGDENCLEHHLSLGLGFFHTCMNASREDQMNMLRVDPSVKYSSLPSALKHNRAEFDYPMDDSSEDGDFLEFDGDSDEDGPNAAWTWTTGNKDEIRYNQSDKQDLRDWGYVMWDKERLDRWDILQENPRDCVIC